jgi:protein involved in polysaccharide export with SLBB domain
MKKMICPQLFLKFSLITVTAALLAGCSGTSQYYDANPTTAKVSPKQSAAQTALDDWAAPQTGANSSPQTTVLRQGDTVKVTFPGSPNLNQTEQVRLDGKISLPLVGDVQAAGQTPD